MMRLPFLLAVLAALAAPFVASAQTQRQPTRVAQAGTLAGLPAAGGIVRSVRIEGAQRIEPATVQSYMVIAAGDRFETDNMDRSIKTLYATGLFADVTMRREGDTLVVAVRENPIVNRVAFEGNRHLGDDVLRGEIQTRPRAVFTRTLAMTDRQRLLDVYARRGRYAASIEPKIIELDQNRVDVVFEIVEGQSTLIRRINFVGNRNFSDSELRDVVSSRESAWWRFLSTADQYDPERLGFDRELLRRFYLRNGYADVEIKGAVAELSADRSTFFLTFTIEEGERYRVGKAEVESRVRNLTAESLAGEITFKPGDWYAADEIEASVNALELAVQNAGYAFVEIRPRFQRNRDTLTVDVTFEVVEGPRVYVERIDIVGNVRTKDKVVRREVRIAEGDAYNAARVNRSRQRIQDLGYFGKVDVQTTEGSAPDRAVVTVEVEERATGELTIGGGYGTDVGFLGTVGLRERNLAGTGLEARGEVTLGQKRSQVDISLTDPYFLDRNLVAGIDVFYITRDNQDIAGFDEERVGVVFRIGYAINEHLRQNWAYSLVRRDITNIDQFASIYIKDQAGKTTNSMVSQILTYDRRNSRIDPTDGYIIRLSADVSGLGGDTGFFRPRIEGIYYQPLAFLTGSRQWTLSFRASTGYLYQYGEVERIIDNFFLGGENLRGFKIGGVGPRDLATNDALGGRFTWTQSTEVRFPMPFLSEDLGVFGRTFVDVGDLRDSGYSGPTVVNNGSPRVSAGVGVTWRSPFGVVNVDLAQAIVKEDYDQTEFFRFGFGTRF
ncbi:MAG: outer membrane protein assembly factor BamA [Acetobacteraceae bacterium]|jgi:outer membrane protein insertion porin family|nr:outer membrane protein assembly factor BamA [Acetobacteraceae bacterium]